MRKHLVFGFFTNPEKVSTKLLIATLFFSQTASAFWWSKPNDYLKNFQQAQQCYQAEDYFCASQYFEQAAWTATNKLARGRAVFNLANSHFKLANFQQAAILYKDAEKWGVASQKVKINEGFAKSLAKSVQKLIDDVQETLRRAQWRSDSQQLTDLMLDKLSQGRFLTPFKLNSKNHQQYLNEINQKIIAGFQQKQAQLTTAIKLRDTTWVQTFNNKKAETTADVLTQLFSIEVGLPIVKPQAIAIKGKRQW